MVGGAVQEARFIHTDTAVYPPVARMGRIQGKVRFQVVIAGDGRVANMRLLSGHPLLVPSAMETVRTRVYQPTLKDGKPIEVETQVDINSSLAE